MNEKLDTHEKDYVVTSDTDSLFIQVKDLALRRHPELATAGKEEWIKVILEIATEIQKAANENIDRVTREYFNVGTRDHYFELKQEVIIERGYFAGKRPKAPKVEPLSDTASADVVVSSLMSFSSSLKSYAESNGYHDISNLADALSGEAAKTKYLLTLS